MHDFNTKDVVIYTKDYCGYCAGAKALLAQRGIAFREIDVTHDSLLQAEMTARSGRRTVPQIFVGNRHVGGFDDLRAMEGKGVLAGLQAGEATSLLRTVA